MPINSGVLFVTSEVALIKFFSLQNKDFILTILTETYVKYCVSAGFYSC